MLSGPVRRWFSDRYEREGSGGCDHKIFYRNRKREPSWSRELWFWFRPLTMWGLGVQASFHFGVANGCDIHLGPLALSYHSQHYSFTDYNLV